MIQYLETRAADVIKRAYFEGRVKEDLLTGLDENTEDANDRCLIKTRGFPS